DPECTTCTTEHPIALPTITTVKTADPADGNEVRQGDTLTYTLTTTIATSATTAPFVLTDTLGAGLSFGAVTDAGGFACSNELVCELPAGTVPGTYAVTYTATVDADATGTVGNSVVVTSNGGDPDPECNTCSTEHPIALPVITIVKSANPGAGVEVSVGDTIEYTLTVTIQNAAIPSELRLTDTPGAGLTVGAMPAGCSTASSTQIVCTMAAGTAPGTYTFVYPATINPAANGEVRNTVTGEHIGSRIEPICESCDTSHVVRDAAELRIVKTAGVRTARIGDMVRYTLTVENLGASNLTNGTVVDTPPAGFSYVEGSMTVADGDGAFDLAAGRYPLRIGGLDIAAGQQATIAYLLRIGAGVRQGTQVNEAVAQNPAGSPISNLATAQVLIESDPLLDDSLIFGTVFDDRDGDGWQDNAALTGVRVQGGFAPGAYIAGSTTVDQGAGHTPVADASAPLLHGIVVGNIAARESEADPIQAHQVVIRQRLTEASFTGDFVLTSDQGVTVRMDAAGNTSVEKSGDAAKGLNAAAPTVERRIAQSEGGMVVEYVIGNAGIDERGIPGVRVASVEGLLIETDQYGRYHLVDVPGGLRGYRNFILKVDPSTLPPGTVFTTDNPRVRRITPGIPVR
ncbi:MAG TPA: isopeptide-forming domain-containing fimbrial protein, partial [Pseudoxanthomonas sp.]|nr:isopeptide-forming domain-containing fimbrial protein [Pseudoxanthomonas sp.]